MFPLMLPKLSFNFTHFDSVSSSYDKWAKESYNNTYRVYNKN